MFSSKRTIKPFRGCVSARSGAGVSAAAAAVRVARRDVGAAHHWNHEGRDEGRSHRQLPAARQQGTAV